MKTTASFLTFSAALGLLVFTGCSSVNSRSEEKSYVFDSLSPDTQQRLSEGKIDIGDTTDMVYIALGDPHEKREKRTANGTETLWVYSSYDRQYEGDVIVGYQRVVRRRGVLGGYTVTREPVAESVYSERVEERFVVTFKNGRVTEIETNE